MTESAKSAVEFMARELPPATKSGFVRAMLPAIEDALSAGHTMKAIWEQVQKYNSALGYKEFSVYVRRIRRRPANQTAPITGKKTAVEEETRGSLGKRRRCRKRHERANPQSYHSTPWQT